MPGSHSGNFPGCPGIPDAQWGHWDSAAGHDGAAEPTTRANALSGRVTDRGSVVARGVRVAGPLVVVVRRLDWVLGVLLSVQLLRQRPEVGLVSPVLQVASDLRLLRLSSAAPHWVDPLAHLAGARGVTAAGARSDRSLVS